MKNSFLLLFIILTSTSVTLAQSSSSSSRSSAAPNKVVVPTQRREPIGNAVQQEVEQVGTPETVYVERPRAVRPQPETVYVERPAQAAPRPTRQVQAEPETVYVEKPPVKKRVAPETIYVDQQPQQQAPKGPRPAKRQQVYQSYENDQPISLGYIVPATNYRKLIMPEDSIPTDFEERLVQTAWKNLPTNRGMESKVKQSQEYLLQTRRSWYTDFLFFAQSNFTDYGNGAGARPTVSPIPSGLGLGFSFGLAQFVNYNSRVRYAREGVNITQSDLNYHKHFMRSETIKRYQSFMMYKNLTKSQTELADEQEMTLKVMKLNFETGQVPVEEFAKIQKAYADAAQLVITSRHNMLMAKAYLEEWIGVKLEEVK